MKSKKTAVNSRIRNTAFAALLFTVLGYLLFEAALFRWGARAGAHVISTIIGAVLFGLIRRTTTLDLPVGTTDGSGTTKLEKSRFITPTNTASFFLLMGIGYGAADVLEGYSATPIVLFAACIYLCPWSRIPLCRSNTFAPFCIIALGAATHMYSGLHLPDPIILAFSVWEFWTIAAGCVLRLAILKKQGRNDPSTAHHATEVDLVTEN
jgi:hypothetical protein